MVEDIRKIWRELEEWIIVGWVVENDQLTVDIFDPIVLIVLHYKQEFKRMERALLSYERNDCWAH